MDVLQEACGLVPENKRPPASQAPCMMCMPEWVAERVPAQKAPEAMQIVRALPPLHLFYPISVHMCVRCLQAPTLSAVPVPLVSSAGCAVLRNAAGHDDQHP